MIRTRTVLFAAALALSAGAFAQGTPQSTYQQDRARCLDGSSGQDKQTCLREMGGNRAKHCRRCRHVEK